MPDRVNKYIKAKEVDEYCENCNEICGRQCVIWRKAEERYNEAAKREKK